MRTPPHFRHTGFHFRGAVNSLLFSVWLICGNGLLRANSSSDGKTPAEYVISVHADRSNGIYHQGEPVTFQIELKHHEAAASEGAVVWKISKDEVAPIQTGTVTINAGKASVSGQLDEPGILHCEVTFNHENTKISALAGAAMDPLEIKPSLPVPDDFDAFWAQKKKELAAVPLNAKLTPVEVPAELRGAEVFEYQADCIGAPSVGYYGRPAGAKPKSLPAVLFVPGAGVRSSNKTAVAEWANRGMLNIDLNAHGIPDGQPAEFYTALEKGELKDYRTRGSESRDTYYFLNVYFRVLRALDFLASQPEWDGRTLVICGGSQGGGLSLAGGALDPRVTYVIANIPALSDHSGMLAHRVAGWPKAVPVGADGKPDDKVLQAMRYFDSANFATRIKVPVHMEVCFLDVICPATCTYVDYNNLRVKKEMVTHPDRGHDIGPQIWGDIERLVAAHVAEQKGSK